MVARVTLAEIDAVRRAPPERIERFKRARSPALQEQEGYEGCYVLLSEEGKVAVITFWTSDEAARASRLSGFYEAQIEKFVDLAIFRAPPGREAYDVVVADAPATRWPEAGDEQALRDPGRHARRRAGRSSLAVALGGRRRRSRCATASSSGSACATCAAGGAAPR